MQSFRNTVKAEDEEGGSLVDRLFGIDLENKLKNKEFPDEPE
jgi:hypothetical protein